MPDQRLARRLKRSTRSVKARRTARGIPLFNPQRHHWTPADDKLLHERPDAQVAMLLGISRMAVLHRRSRLGILRPGAEKYRSPRPWPPAEEALLGTTSDVDLAFRLGRTLSDVHVHRQRLGVVAHGFHWTADADVQLGKVPDAKLAGRLGVTVKAVARRRERLGIPKAPRNARRGG